MRIGVVAPARPVNREGSLRMAAFMALTYPAHDIVFHPQCYLEVGHFAGTDEQRAAAFLEFANDPGFDAIWFARGGYGSNRILDRVIPQLNSAAKAKTYAGFSDMGFMLGALSARRIGQSVHASMASSLGVKDTGEAAGWALGWLIDRDRRALEPSLADGRPAAAFNLSILTSLIGTQWLPDLTMIEPGLLTPEARHQLEAMGHHFKEIKSWGADEAILVNPKTHLLEGANDRRRPAGLAAGY